MKITSKNNPHIKAIRRLHQRKTRQQTGTFVVEGIHWTIEALTQPERVQTVLYCPETLTSAHAWDAISHARSYPHIQVCTTDAAVMQSLSQRDNPVGLMAVVAQQWTPLDDVTSGLWVALSAVQYPGNLGTILRTCDATGTAGVILLDHATDPHHPEAVRASLGTILTRRIVSTTTADFAAWKAWNAYPVVGADDSAAHTYRSVDYPARMVLMLGSEGQGLTGEQRALCDTLVCIPMCGSGDSLNVAIASAVILYEILAQQDSRVTQP